MALTEMALNNPLIDEYSLKGAKGLLINITGGSDLTLFEVDQTVQKVRDEVDTDAELIFGAIKDDSMNGKMRVSIATALDGHKTETKTVLNMVSRLHSRNSMQSDNLFSHNPKIDSGTYNSIDGATALKLDESYEIKEDENSSINTIEQNNPSIVNNENINDQTDAVIPSGVSMENASYMEESIQPNISDTKETNFNISNNIDEEYTPKLFSEDVENSTENHLEENDNTQTDKLFDQDLNEDEDFEIQLF